MNALSSKVHLPSKEHTEVLSGAGWVVSIRLLLLYALRKTTVHEAGKKRGEKRKEETVQLTLRRGLEKAAAETSEGKGQGY